MIGKKHVLLVQTFEIHDVNLLSVFCHEMMCIQ